LIQDFPSGGEGAPQIRQATFARLVKRGIPFLWKKDTKPGRERGGKKRSITLAKGEKNVPDFSAPKKSAIREETENGRQLVYSKEKGDFDVKLRETKEEEASLRSLRGKGGRRFFSRCPERNFVPGEKLRKKKFCNSRSSGKKGPGTPRLCVRGGGEDLTSNSPSKHVDLRGNNF